MRYEPAPTFVTAAGLRVYVFRGDNRRWYWHAIDRRGLLVRAAERGRRWRWQASYDAHRMT